MVQLRSALARRNPEVVDQVVSWLDGDDVKRRFDDSLEWLGQLQPTAARGLPMIHAQNTVPVFDAWSQRAQSLAALLATRFIDQSRAAAAVWMDDEDPPRRFYAFRILALGGVMVDASAFHARALATFWAEQGVTKGPTVSDEPASDIVAALDWCRARAGTPAAAAALRVLDSGLERIDVIVADYTQSGNPYLVKRAGIIARTISAVRAEFAKP